MTTVNDSCFSPYSKCLVNSSPLRCCCQGHLSLCNNTFLFVTLPNIHQFQFFFTYRLSNKPFLIWSLATPPHVKYVATLPCNLSLIACFLTLMFHKVAWQNIHVLQGYVAKYARCAETFKNHFTANFLENIPVKEFEKNSQNYGHEFRFRFFGQPCILHLVQLSVL